MNNAQIISKLEEIIGLLKPQENDIAVLPPYVNITYWHRKSGAFIVFNMSPLDLATNAPKWHSIKAYKEGALICMIPVPTPPAYLDTTFDRGDDSPVYSTGEPKDADSIRQACDYAVESIRTSLDYLCVDPFVSLVVFDLWPDAVLLDVNGVDEVVDL